jgi:hypothetical protein
MIEKVFRCQVCEAPCIIRVQYLDKNKDIDGLMAPFQCPLNINDCKWELIE